MTATGVTAELRSYHVRHAQMLSQLLSGTPDVQELPALLPKTVLEMMRHLVQEEVFLLPLVRERLGAALADACAGSLAGIEDAIRAVAATAPEDPEFRARMERLHQDYVEHARWQEQDLFPQVEQELSADLLDDVGGAVNETVEEGPTQSHPSGLRLSSTGWPAPQLVDELREHLRSQAVGRTGL